MLFFLWFTVSCWCLDIPEQVTEKCNRKKKSWVCKYRKQFRDLPCNKLLAAKLSTITLS